MADINTHAYYKTHLSLACHEMRNLQRPYSVLTYMVFFVNHLLEEYMTNVFSCCTPPDIPQDSQSGKCKILLTRDYYPPYIWNSEL